MRCSRHAVAGLFGLLLLAAFVAPPSLQAEASGIDCFVSDEPSTTGPSAPTDLQVDHSPGHFGFFQLRWTDNSDIETCFLVEVKHTTAVAVPFEPLAILAANQTTFTDGPYEEGEFAYYRVYAADGVDRSDYSNTAGVGIPFLDNTPTPGPQILRGDLNCDGSIDAVDALVVLREDAGLDPNLPADCPALTSVVGVTEIAAGGAVAGVAGLILAAGVLASRRHSSPGKIAD